MRNFGVLAVLVLAAVSFVGCGTPDVDREQEFKWTTHIVFRYEMTQVAGAVGESAKVALEGLVRAAAGNSKASVEMREKILDVVVPFDGIASMRFKSVKSAFYINQYATFGNPLIDVIEAGGLAELIDTAVRGDETATPDPIPAAVAVTDKAAESILVLDLPVRATAVTGTVNAQMFADEVDGKLKFRYSIKTDKAEITAHWQFANQSAWYVVAIGATGVFMLALFVVLRGHRNRQAIESGTR